MTSFKSLLDRGATPAFVWTSTITGLLVMLLFFAGVSWDFYRSAVSSAEQQAGNIAALVEQDIARDIELYDLSLQAVLEGIADPEVMSQSAHVRQIALFDRSASAQGMGALVVLDRDGTIVHDSLSAIPRNGNFADREYFKFHQKPRTGLYISKPFKARLQNDASSISLSRRVTNPDGSFGGIVNGTVKLDYIRARFDKVRLGAKGTITLLRDDGVMLVQNVKDDHRIGADWSSTQVIRQLPQHSVGSYWSESSMDGTTRLFAYRRIGGLPLVVSVGMASNEILAPWREKTTYLAICYFMMAASILVLVAMFVRELHRREAAEQTQASLARQDALTKLSNRLGFNEALEKEWRRARRNQKPLSLLLLDLDYFKQFNDTQGHLEGDRILAEVADVVNGVLRRPFDVGARYGGEEFAVLLPNTTAEGAIALARIIRHAVEMLGVPHAQSGHGVVTVSVGAATVTVDDSPPATLISLADEALYAAKKNGRNRVEVANVSIGSFAAA